MDSLSNLDEYDTDKLPVDVRSDLAGNPGLKAMHAASAIRHIFLGVVAATPRLVFRKDVLRCVLIACYVVALQLHIRHAELCVARCTACGSTRTADTRQDLQLAPHSDWWHKRGPAVSTAIALYQALGTFQEHVTGHCAVWLLFLAKPLLHSWPASRSSDYTLTSLSLSAASERHQPGVTGRSNVAPPTPCLSRVALLCLYDPSQTADAYQCLVDLICNMQDDKY